MKYALGLILAMFFSMLYAQNTNMGWAKNMGGASRDFGNSIAVDASGNVYTTGTFIGTADFDPGPDTYNLTAEPTNDDLPNIFISKLDALGHFVWAKKIGGSDDNSQGIAVDASGNVYTIGWFGHTVDFDPGPGIYNLTAGGCQDIYISKLDASGNFVWAKNMRGYSDIYRCSIGNGVSIVVDDSGNVYTTGGFKQTTDFDPGPETYNLTAVGYTDIFVSKLNSSGNFVWAKSMGGASTDLAYSDNFGRSIAIDATGNVYTTGSFYNTVDFDPGPGIFNLTSVGSTGGFNIFISKLDASGNFVWAKNIADSFSDYSNSLAVDPSNNVYITGFFWGMADFDPGPGIYNLTSAGSQDIFIMKLDALGNLVWAKDIGGLSYDVGTSITLDSKGNIYIAGNFRDTVDFDPGPKTFYLSAGPNNALAGFTSKLDSSGKFLWAFTSPVGRSVAIDTLENVYATGCFENKIDFDPGPGTDFLTSAGDFDIFVIKLNNDGILTLPVTLTNVKAYQIGPAVEIEWISQQENNIDRYEVERSQNGQQFSALGGVKAKGNSSLFLDYNLFDPNPFSGVNFYRIKVIDKSGQVTYSRVMKVNVSNRATLLTVYPNPVNGNTIVLQMNNQQKGIYTINITNKLGQLLITKVVRHPGGSATETIEPRGTLSAGVYQLRLTGEGFNITLQLMIN